MSKHKINRRFLLRNAGASLALLLGNEIESVGRPLPVPAPAAGAPAPGPACSVRAAALMKEMRLREYQERAAQERESAQSISTDAGPSRASPGKRSAAPRPRGDEQPATNTEYTGGLPCAYVVSLLRSSSLSR